MTHSLCHVLFVTHKLRTVHEMRDTQCHTCALNNFVVSSRNTLENFFGHFKIFATTWHALLHLTCIATHTVTSSSLIGTPNCVYYVNRASVRLDVNTSLFLMSPYQMKNRPTCLLCSAHNGLTARIIHGGP